MFLIWVTAQHHQILVGARPPCGTAPFHAAAHFSSSPHFQCTLYLKVQSYMVAEIGVRCDAGEGFYKPRFHPHFFVAQKQISRLSTENNCPFLSQKQSLGGEFCSFSQLDVRFLTDVSSLVREDFSHFSHASSPVADGFQMENRRCH